MIFSFMLLGPDLVAQKIGLVELKVGQKMGSWLKFLSLSFLSRSLIIIFSTYAFRARSGTLKTGLAKLKSLSENRESCLVNVSSMNLSFVFLLTKTNMFIREQHYAFCLQEKQKKKKKKKVMFSLLDNLGTYLRV
jgi:hypothetical protein